MTYLTKNLAFLVVWTEYRQFMQKKCLWKKVVPKHPFSLTAFGSSPKGAPLRSYRKVSRHC